jgi:hypothetical protein
MGSIWARQVVVTDCACENFEVMITTWDKIRWKHDREYVHELHCG